MPPRRVRRPLLALIVLVLAVAVGYLWRAVDSDAAPVHSSIVVVTDVTAGLAPGVLPARHT